MFALELCTLLASNKEERACHQLPPLQKKREQLNGEANLLQKLRKTGEMWLLWRCE